MVPQPQAVSGPNMPEDGGDPPDNIAETFRSLAVDCPDGVVVADVDGRVVWANDTAHALFGRHAGSMVGAPVTHLVPADSVNAARRLRRRLLAGEHVGPLVTTGLRPDGTRFPLSLAAAVRWSTDGRAVGLNAIVRDLTQERRIQQDLTEELARSYARFDHVAQPQALLDLRARVVAVNDATCRLLGRERSELLDLDARTLVRPVDPDDAASRLRALEVGAAEAFSLEAVVTGADGAPVPVLLEASVVHDDSGVARELAVFISDLSRMRESQRRLASRDTFLSRLYRRAADPAFIVDAGATITYVSPSFTDVLGYAHADIVGHYALELVHPDDEPLASSVLARLVSRPGSTERLVMRGQSANGGWVSFDTVVTNCLDEPEVEGLIVNLRDVTAEVRARESLRQSELRYRTIVETAQEGILTIDLSGSVTFANAKAAEILGTDLQTLYSPGVLSLLSEEQRKALLGRLATRAQKGPERFEMVYSHPERGEVLIEIAASPLMDDDGAPMGSLTMIADVTSERRVAEGLRHQAMHDPLTGLPNRMLLVDRLAMAGARQARDPGRLAALFLDLDGFKMVNDGHGHGTGDRVLVETAARLRHAVRETDTVARFGGDEFAVLCEEASPEEVQSVADRILAALQEPYEVDSEPVHVSTSIGVAMSPPHRPDDLLAHADAAMYQAKAAGRGRITVFEPTRGEKERRRSAIVTALPDALDQEALAPAYQPIVDLASGALLGLEASVSWAPESLGSVRWEEVLEAAETAGVTYELDQAVLGAAGRDLGWLRDARLVRDDVFVSVSPSPGSTRRRWLERLAGKMLEATSLPAGCLVLGVGERSLTGEAGQPPDQPDQLDGLAAVGVGVLIENLGGGFDSMVALQQVRAAGVKIDRAFVSRVHVDRASRVVTESIVSRAADLGMSTVALGVDTPHQLAALREIGCVSGLGRLWGRPTGRSGLPRLLGGWVP